jgi:hypothetical protein
MHNILEGTKRVFIGTDILLTREICLMMLSFEKYNGIRNTST